MTNEGLFPFLLASYSILMLLSLGVSILTYLGNRTPETRHAPLYWASGIFCFGIQGLPHLSPQLTAITILSSLPTVLVLASMSKRLFGCGLRPAQIIWTGVFGASGWLILQALTEEFWIYALPPAAAAGGLFIANSLTCYRSSATTSGKLLHLVVGFSGLHVFDFPFLRLNPDFLLAGFGVGYVNGVLMSILVPVVIIEGMRRNYTLQLEGEIAKATADLKRRNDELKEAQEEIQELVMILCHDMGNSVSVTKIGFEAIARSIHSYIELASTPQFDLRKWIPVVRNAISGQAELIESVRTLQKITQEKGEVQTAPVDLSAAFDKVAFNFEEKLRSKSIKLTSEIPAEARASIEEATFVHCVLGNLISNAIKFSFPNSSIHVSAVVYPQQIELKIEDEGIGIEQERMEGLFSSRRGLSTSGTQDERGMGFGLHIVRRILEASGGSVAVKSRALADGCLSHGTSFIITLRRFQMDL